jgi:NAD(P)-dependent dehydrogenase (short-subunit alcohol dehydrogenase family)
MSQGWTDKDVPDQTGRTILITGANSGLGFESARVLAKRGAQVVLACRNVAKGNEAAAAIRSETPGAKVEVVALDLADLSQVRAAAKAILERFPRIDVLMNNAGLMALPYSKTKDGFEMQLGTNHFGHYVLTGLLLPALEAAPEPRIVNVLSLYHQRGRMNFDDLDFTKTPYNKWDAYAQSKLANLLFSTELSARLAKKGSRIKVVSAHPGYASTNLQGKGPELAGSIFEGLVMKLSNALFAQPSAHGAWPQLRAATDPAAKPNEYFGPLGFKEMRGPAGHVEARSKARNPELAARLWEISKERTGDPFGDRL